MSASGKIPNLAAVLLVNLGCESVVLDEVAQAIAATGKHVEQLVIQDEGGAARSAAKGELLAQELVMEASRHPTERCPASDLILGLSVRQLRHHPGALRRSGRGDRHGSAGGSRRDGHPRGRSRSSSERSISSPSTRALPRSPGRLLTLVDRMEARAKAAGCDMRGGQPTGGNIGGALDHRGEVAGRHRQGRERAHRGRLRLRGAPPGDRAGGDGLPGREPEILTGLAAAGANLIAFATGRGAPQGFPFVPVMKITGNPVTWNKLRDHMDLYVGTILEGTETLPAAGQRLLGTFSFASGRRTKAEISGYTNSMDIYVTGPVI